MLHGIRFLLYFKQSYTFQSASISEAIWWIKYSCDEHLYPAKTHPSLTRIYLSQDDDEKGDSPACWKCFRHLHLSRGTIHYRKILYSGNSCCHIFRTISVCSLIIFTLLNLKQCPAVIFSPILPKLEEPYINTYREEFHIFLLFVIYV